MMDSEFHGNMGFGFPEVTFLLLSNEFKNMLIYKEKFYIYKIRKEFEHMNDIFSDNNDLISAVATDLKNYFCQKEGI
jgi:hypothetical protein